MSSKIVLFDLDCKMTKFTVVEYLKIIKFQPILLQKLQ